MNTKVSLVIGEGEFKYRPDPEWGRLPNGWRYVEVASVATDSADNVYVFNRGDHPVIVFDQDGNFLHSWGEGSIVRAHGIYITPNDRLFLTDDKDHTVTEYTLDGELIMRMGESGKPSNSGVIGMDYRTIVRATEPFNMPTNLISDGENRLFITDGYGNARVHVFSSAGEYEFSWGSLGSGPGEFHLPHGLDVDSKGRVFVADRENNRIQIFDAEGTFLEEWIDIIRPTDLFINDDDTVFVAEEGLRCGLFPWMTPDPNAIGGRLSIFSDTGALLARWGGGHSPCSPNDFYAPHSMWLDSAGTIYVGEVNWSAGGKDGELPPDCPCLRRYIRV